MTIQDIMREAHKTATEKGWHEKPLNFPEQLMLVVTELAEAMEAYRHGAPMDIIERGGIAEELADVVIRVCDLSAELNIPLAAALDHKMAYNKTRAHKHGGKVV